jgi:transcriptional regulator with XRE-family HTH domain
MSVKRYVREVLMEVEKAFGICLKKLRQQNVISQENLAMLSDLDRTYISLLERGLRNPSIGTLFKLADALNVRPAYIIGEVEKILLTE